MTTDEAKKELMVVHRDSPIGETHEHFYSVSSVNRVIEKLVNKINELENKIELRKYNIGDEVWTFFDGEPTAGKITKTGAIIECCFEHKGKVHKYRRVAEGFHLPRTKEELLKSL